MGGYYGMRQEVRKEKDNKEKEIINFLLGRT